MALAAFSLLPMLNNCLAPTGSLDYPPSQLGKHGRKASLCSPRGPLAILANPIATMPKVFDQLDFESPTGGMILDRDAKTRF